MTKWTKYKGIVSFMASQEDQREVNVYKDGSVIIEFPCIAGGWNERAKFTKEEWAEVVKFVSDCQQ